MLRVGAIVSAVQLYVSPARGEIHGSRERLSAAVARDPPRAALAGGHSRNDTPAGGGGVYRSPALLAGRPRHRVRALIAPGASLVRYGQAPSQRSWRPWSARRDCNR